MKNVKNMCVEDVRVVSVVKISDSLMKRGNVVAWQEMMRNKRDMALNTVTYSIKVNNRYEKNVKFVFNAITQKTTDATDPRKVYYSIEIEDVDGEFGKIICTTDEIRNPNGLKNKLTTEYRKTLIRREKETQALKNENKKLHKDIEEKQAIINYKDKKHQDEINEIQGKMAQQQIEFTNEMDDTIKKYNIIIKDKDNELALIKKENEELKNNRKGSTVFEGFKNVGLKKLVNTIIKLHNYGLDIDAIVTRIEKLNK